VREKGRRNAPRLNPLEKREKEERERDPLSGTPFRDDSLCEE